MLESMNYINVYIASKKRLYGDLYLNPKNGDIYRECGNYQQRFREYIRNNKLYVVIDGIMYNKAKLIYDSVNKDNLPTKRYKVIVNNNDITHPTIDNIEITDLRSQENIITNNDENIIVIEESKLVNILYRKTSDIKIEEVKIFLKEIQE